MFPVILTVRVELLGHASHGSPVALRYFITKLFDDDYYSAEAASESFFHIGRRAVPQLIRVLTDRTAPNQTRVLAAEALNNILDPRGTTAVLQILDDETKNMLLRRPLSSYLGNVATSAVWGGSSASLSMIRRTGECAEWPSAQAGSCFSEMSLTDSLQLRDAPPVPVG